MYHNLFFPRAPDLVRLGEHDFTSTLDNSQHLDYAVARILAHPEYRKEGPFASYHDLALIELAEDVQFSVGGQTFIMMFMKLISIFSCLINFLVNEENMICL